MIDLENQNPKNIAASLEVPKGESFQKWMETRIAKLETRSYDWDALAFQYPIDPRYRRAQIRYIGTGGTGVRYDRNTIPSVNFTFSTMLIPSGHIGPLHVHIDVEEVFFIIRGKVKIICEKDGEYWETICTDRDLISIPPNIYRSEINIGDEEALMCVMLGSSNPITPTYPFDSKLSKIDR